MPAEELKLCPFCGSTSVGYHQSFAKSKVSIFYYHFYKCSNCGASSKGSDQFKALENWNRRAGTMEAKIYSAQIAVITQIAAQIEHELDDGDKGRRFISIDSHVIEDWARRLHPFVNVVFNCLPL